MVLLESLRISFVKSLLVSILCCSSAFAAEVGGNPVDPAPYEDAARTACDPACKGGCFNGHCLFAGEGIADAGQQISPALSQFSAESTSANALPPVEELLATATPVARQRAIELLEQRRPDLAQKLKSMIAAQKVALPSGPLPSYNFGLPVMQQASPVAVDNVPASWQNFGVLPAPVGLAEANVMGAGAMPLSLLRGGFGAASSAAAEAASLATAGTSPLLLQQVVAPNTQLGALPYLAQAGPPAALQVRLGAAEAEAARLAGENNKLREQLHTWHEAGAHVAAREKKLGELLVEAGLHPQLDNEKNVSALQQTGAHARSQDAESIVELGVLQTRYYTIVLAEAVILILVAALAYKNKDRLLGAFEPDPNSKHPRKVVRSSKESLGLNLSRMVGMADYPIEVSELQIGGVDKITIVGQAYVTLRVGSGESAMTGMVRPRADSSYLPFGEVFQVNIGKVDNSCVISLYDKDEFLEELVAVAEIPSSQFVNMAQQRTEYFRIPLKPQSHRFAEAAADCMPFVALRVRDASGHGPFSLCADAAGSDGARPYGAC